MKKKVQPQDNARVIRLSRNGSLDYFIPRARARQLFDEGKLWIDLTNSKPEDTIYCSQTPEEQRRQIPGEIVK